MIQKETGEGVSGEMEQQFIDTTEVMDPKNPEKVIFTQNGLFSGENDRCIADSAKTSTNPYGKAAMEYRHGGGIEGICGELHDKLSADLGNNLSLGRYYNDDDYVEKLQGEEERRRTFDYLPKEIAKDIPELYATDGGLIGDKTAYLRYFMPFSSYTCYVLEADKHTGEMFALVTLGYGWELGYTSLAEIESVKVSGIRIERDIHFEPTKLHEIEELKEYVGNRFTPENTVKEERRIEPGQDEKPFTLTVKSIGDALKKYESYTGEGEDTDRILADASRRGYVTITFATQASWTSEESLERACKELEGMTLCEWRKANIDPAVYEMMYHKEIETERKRQEVQQRETENKPEETTREEKAPEGVPVLTLYDLFDSARPDWEEPRKIDGQTVYFDEEHHPISVMSDNDDDLDLPESGADSWLDEMERFNEEIKAAAPSVTPKPEQPVLSADRKDRKSVV